MDFTLEHDAALGSPGGGWVGSGATAPAVPATGLFGLVVPGGPVRTDFCPVDASGLKFAIRLHCPGDVPAPLASVTELVFFLLPNTGHLLPPANNGVMCYWQITAAAAAAAPSATAVPDGGPASTGFELLGAITPDRPSVVFQTGWSEHEHVMEVSKAGVPVILTIGISLEPVANLHNVGALPAGATGGGGGSMSNNQNQARLFVAEKIASDLYRFMQSFDTSSAKLPGAPGQMVVPTNIFDRWFKRFESRFKRDPNFFLRPDDS